jgi:enolase
VANQVGFVKIGGFYRSERVSKINRLIEIEEFLKERDLLVETPEKVYEFATNFQIPEEVAEQLARQEEAASLAKKPGKK